MKNASFYILTILVLGLIGNPLSQHALTSQHEISNGYGLGVNAFAESDEDEQDNEHDSELDKDQSEGDTEDIEDESGDESEDELEESEDDTDAEDDTAEDTEDIEDGTNEDTENDTEELESDNKDESGDESKEDTEDDTEDESEDNSDDDKQYKQKSEAKTEQIISKLEQKIEQLEQRIQSLLEKVQTGQYFGSIENTDQIATSYTMSFDGTATSIQDQSVSAPISADIFAETLMVKDGFTKLRITGGQIDVGQATYDVVFGKARVTDNPSDQGSFVLLVAEIMDDNGDITTIRMNLDSAQSFQMADSQSIDLQIGSPQSKIAGQWLLQGTGSLSS